MRIHPLLAVFLMASILCGSAYAASPENVQYAECTRNLANDPEGAYKRARAWYGQSKSVAAQHCMAMAHYQLQEYAQAAIMLDQVLLGITPSQGKLWLFAKGQAASAHLAAGKPDAARKHLDEALRWAMDKGMDADMVPLLTQRALLLAQLGQPLKAVQDFDHAMSIRPSSQIKLRRAELLLKMGKTTQAMEDVDAVLKVEPNNVEARALGNAAE